MNYNDTARKNTIYAYTILDYIYMCMLNTYIVHFGHLSPFYMIQIVQIDASTLHIYVSHLLFKVPKRPRLSITYVHEPDNGRHDLILLVLWEIQKTQCKHKNRYRIKLKYNGTLSLNTLNAPLSVMRRQSTNIMIIHAL
jgi:hypothetical protein